MCENICCFFNYSPNTPEKPCLQAISICEYRTALVSVEHHKGSDSTIAHQLSSVISDAHSFDY